MAYRTRALAAVPVTPMIIADHALTYCSAVFDQRRVVVAISTTCDWSNEQSPMDRWLEWMPNRNYNTIVDWH